MSEFDSLFDAFVGEDSVTSTTERPNVEAVLDENNNFSLSELKGQNKENIQKIRDEIKEIRKDIRDKFEKQREEIRKEVSDLKEATKEKVAEYDDKLGEPNGNYLVQNGKEVYKFATRILPRAVNETLKRANLIWLSSI